MGRDKNVAAVIAYITIDLGISTGTFCDIGGSVGFLTSRMLDCGFDAYCIDGHDYAIKNDILLIPRDRYAIFDLREDIKPYIHGPFDVTTSFEMLEHIPKDDIESVIQNIKHISKTFIASIHHGGKEHCNHYNIRPLQWWIDTFNVIGNVTTVDLPLEQFGESSYIKVEF
jgi:2-polyprenyl-3-methyl-5-hydroxy-6-metoxy-1,4-benzoquinol methylase